MKHCFLPAAVALAVLSVLTPQVTHAQTRDVAGASDHADVPRVDGAVARAWRHVAVGDIRMPLAAINSRDDLETVPRHVQGEIKHTDYVIRPARTPLEMDRHYEEALRRNGYQTLYACAGISACGSRMGELILLSDKVAPIGLPDGLFNDHLRVRVARKGSTWVLLHMIQGPDRALVYQAVVEGARDLD
ncbi:hypothetical protein [Brevundimonas sp.]|uniref:hypothetical protein n=1 Tax=Brevundimonas sp. TaxID=1871086 RepID=UPI0028A70EF8|nr:hypothetical protein [Brevundimonas sp.]